ncbi:MAG: hypothetical protein JWP89_6182 [Schlesneria sp.]|nr:hypothetical protein [Schlesneria sp.]
MGNFLKCPSAPQSDSELKTPFGSTIMYEASDQSARYYYCLFGTEFGPFSRTDLESLIVTRRLPTDAEVREHLDKTWVLVADLYRVESEACDAAASTPSTSTVPNVVAPTPREELDAWFSRTMSREKLEQSANSSQDFVRPLPSPIVEPSTQKRSFSWLRDPLLWRAVVVLLVVNGVVLWLQPPSNAVDEKRYEIVHEMLTEIRQKRAAQPTNEEWDSFAIAMTQKAESLMNELSEDGDAPARQCLQWALQYRLPRVLKYGRYRASYQEAAYEHLLQEAKRHLHRKS